MAKEKTTYPIYKFNRVADLAEKYNSKNKTQRFQVMTKNKGTQLVEVGLYDTKSKRWVLVDTRHYTLDSCIKEMEEMIQGK